MYGAESRATERSRWHLRAQSVTLAWHEDSAYSHEVYRFLRLTAPIKGRPTDLAPSGRGSVLCSLEHRAQGRAASGQDEDREAVRQDVLFRKLDLGLFARR